MQKILIVLIYIGSQLNLHRNNNTNLSFLSVFYNDAIAFQLIFFFYCFMLLINVYIIISPPSPTITVFNLLIQVTRHAKNILKTLFCCINKNKEIKQMSFNGIFTSTSVSFFVCCGFLFCFVFITEHLISVNLFYFMLNYKLPFRRFSFMCFHMPNKNKINNNKRDLCVIEHFVCHASNCANYKN